MLRCKLFTFGFAEAKELSQILVILRLFLNNIKKKRNLFLFSNFFIFLHIFSPWISCLYLSWFQFNFSRCIYPPEKLFSVCFQQRDKAFFFFIFLIRGFIVTLLLLLLFCFVFFVVHLVRLVCPVIFLLISVSSCAPSLVFFFGI